ncbi:CopG family transcriptional regulator [Moorena sp. SIO4A1]|uniref:plasmid mobilization protein n=1 Tax=Moorena sp. SIO4A1 TaxID=2607835 RepID=UPI0025D764A6|nr:CopG family transcriptional regulator [Moorena sp. SIO4A1]
MDIHMITQNPEKMKDKKLIVRVTEFEKRQLKQEADKRGMTPSELIRSFIARLPVPQDS